MNQAEFIKGWTKLILQPWGWRYQSMTQDGRPSDQSKLQLEFYYEKLKWAHPLAWLKVADLFAQGDEWPSINVLLVALRNINSRYVKAVTDQRGSTGEAMPEEMKAQLGRLMARKGMPG